MKKIKYKLIIVIGYKELHFDFDYVMQMHEFISQFNQTLIVNEEDGKEVKMSVVIVTSDNTVTAEDESED